MAVSLFRVLGTVEEEVMSFDENLKPTFQPNFQKLGQYFQAFGISLPNHETVYLPLENPSQKELQLFKASIEHLIANQIEYQDYFWKSLNNEA